MNGVHQVLQYLKGTQGQGVMFSVIPSLHISAYLDADRGRCITTRKSTTEFWIFIDESLVAWRSKKQATMLRSSGQAEYRVLVSATSKLLWLKQLLKAFNVDVL